MVGIPQILTAVLTAKRSVIQHNTADSGGITDPRKDKEKALQVPFLQGLN